MSHVVKFENKLTVLCIVFYNEIFHVDLCQENCKTEQF